MKLLIALFAAAFLCGCMPFMVATNYFPQTDNLKLVHHGCGPAIRPLNAIEYRIDDVLVYVQAYSSKTPETAGVIVSLEIPAEVTVVLKEPRVLFRYGSDNRLEGASTTTRKDYPRSHEQVGTLLKGHTDKTLSKYGTEFISNSTYTISSGVEGLIADEFYVTLPEMSVNGKNFSIPEIRFLRQTFYGFFVPVNC